MQEITIQQRAEDFAIRVIKAYTTLSNRRFDDAGKVLAKQFLRSGHQLGLIVLKLFMLNLEMISYQNTRSRSKKHQKLSTG